MTSSNLRQFACRKLVEMGVACLFILAISATSSASAHNGVVNVSVHGSMHSLDQHDNSVGVTALHVEENSASLEALNATDFTIHGQTANADVHEAHDDV